MRKTQKSRPLLGTASSISDEPDNRLLVEDTKRRKPHLQNLVPADSRPDVGGEDDWTFFRSRPLLRSRIRIAFPGEFPRELLKQASGRQVVVIVAVERHPITGEPQTRGRGILFIDGGRA